MAIRFCILLNVARELNLNHADSFHFLDDLITFLDPSESVNIRSVDTFVLALRAPSMADSSASKLVFGPLGQKFSDVFWFVLVM